MWYWTWTQVVRPARSWLVLSCNAVKTLSIRNMDTKLVFIYSKKYWFIALTNSTKVKLFRKRKGHWKDDLCRWWPRCVSVTLSDRGLGNQHNPLSEVLLIVYSWRGRQCEAQNKRDLSLSPKWLLHRLFLLRFLQSIVQCGPVIHQHFLYANKMDHSVTDERRQQICTKSL